MSASSKPVEETCSRALRCQLFAPCLARFIYRHCVSRHPSRRPSPEEKRPFQNRVPLSSIDSIARLSSSTSNQGRHRLCLYRSRAKLLSECGTTMIFSLNIYSWGPGQRLKCKHGYMPCKANWEKATNDTLLGFQRFVGKSS